MILYFKITLHHHLKNEILLDNNITRFRNIIFNILIIEPMIEQVLITNSIGSTIKPKIIKNSYKSKKPNKTDLYFFFYFKFYEFLIITNIIIEPIKLIETRTVELIKLVK